MREHVRNDDGRLQACGWSLPAKYKQVLQGAMHVHGWGRAPGGSTASAPALEGWVSAPPSMHLSRPRPRAQGISACGCS